MGYFKGEELQRLTLPSDENYWVEVPKVIAYGESKKFAVVREDGVVDVTARADLFLLTVIKNWNLDDEDGNILPINQESIDILKGSDAIMILNTAGALVETEDQKKSSTSK